MKLKRILAAALTVTMLTVSFLSNPTLAAKTTAAASAELKKGTSLEGFTVTKTQLNQSNGSQLITFEHQKTGAELLWIKNEDKNRGFSIGFHSPAADNKGINHILEHSLISSSKKYPDTNLLFSVSNNTYTSYINAFTYQNMTLYPVTSLSEAQLLKLTDIYMDCVYNPSILTEKKIFDREAWRYELANAKEPLTVNGTVYNEMRGNMGNIHTAALYNTRKTIFPGSSQSTISGGNPSDVLKLSYKEFLTTYQKYYHPSNSLMVLYGDLEISRFLKLINQEYLSGFSKKTIKTTRDITKPFDKLTVKDYDFPAAKGSETKNKAVIDYSFAGVDIKKIGISNYSGLVIVAAALNMDSSPFKQNLIKSGIAGSYSISLDADIYQPILHITAYDADASKKNEFCKLVDTELKNIVQKGFDSKLLSSLISSLRFDKALQNEGQVGLQAMVSAQLMNSVLGDPAADTNEYLEQIGKKIGSGYLERLVSEFCVSNQHRTLVTTSPKPGLLEKNDAALAKQLAEKKAAMSKKEIDAMVKAGNDYKTWNSRPSDPKLIQSLKGISVSELPVEIPEFNISDTRTDGARILSTEAAIKDVCQTNLIFDVSHLSKEDLLYLQFYFHMLSYGMPTDTLSEQQTVNLFLDTARGFNANVSSSLKDYKNPDSAYPAAMVSFSAMNTEYSKASGFVLDLLNHSKLEDSAAYISRTLNYLKAMYTQQLAEPLNLILTRSMAYSDLSARYMDYLTGLGYYQFIIKLEKQAAADPQVIIDRLIQVRENSFLKKDLTILFAGDQEALNAFDNAKTDIIGSFSGKECTPASHTLPIPAQKEAWTTNTTVQYVSYMTNLKKAGYAPNGGMATLSTLLDNVLLLPELRYKGGAYGAGAVYGERIYGFYSYRDNNYVNSLAIMGGSDEFLKALSAKGLKDSDLESYILSTFGKYNAPGGELSSAVIALGSALSNTSREDRIRALEEIKSIKASDLKGYAAMLEKLNTDANYVVVASPEMISQNSGLFDKIIPMP